MFGVSGGWLTEREAFEAVARKDDHGPVDPGLRRAYRAGVAGLVPADLDQAAVMGLMPVPGYRVTTDPDGWFRVVTRRVVTEVERAVLMGAVRRRFLLGIVAGDGQDPFRPVRYVRFEGRWPDDADGQPRAFPCPVCGMISWRPEDVESRYCRGCRRFTGDPEDPTPGSPYARTLVPGVDESGVVGGIRRPARVFEPIRNPLATCEEEDRL